VAFKTPDRFAGARQEEELQLDDRTADGDPSIEGAIRRVGNVLKYYVNSAVTQIARWKAPPANFDGVDLTGLTDGQGISYNASGNQFEPQTLSLTKVSSNDTTAGYLNGKLVAGDGIQFTEQNDGGDETLEIQTKRKWQRHFLLMGG